MKFFVGDKVVALSGDHSHETGTVLKVIPVAAGRESTRLMYLIRFAKGQRWHSHSTLRQPYRHEVQK